MRISENIRVPLLLGDEIDLSQPAAPVSLDQPQAC